MSNLPVRRNSDIMDYGYTPVYSPLRKSPETALAENSPSSALKLLERQSQRMLYEGCVSTGGSIVNTYISRSSQENVDRINEIDLDVKHSTGFFGRDRGVSMRIKFKKTR